MEGVNQNTKRHYEIFKPRKSNGNKRLKPENDHILTTSELTQKQNGSKIMTESSQSPHCAQTKPSRCGKYITE